MYAFKQLHAIFFHRSCQSMYETQLIFLKTLAVESMLTLFLVNETKIVYKTADCVRLRT